MMTECLRHKPEEPSHYLLKWLIDRNANKGSEEVAVASTSDSMHVAVTHPDPTMQQVHCMQMRSPRLWKERVMRQDCSQPVLSMFFCLCCIQQACLQHIFQHDNSHLVYLHCMMQYLKDKKLHLIFLEFMKLVSNRSPVMD